MKGLVICVSMLVLLSFMSSGNSFAQPMQKFQKKTFKENLMEKLNLTDQQKDKISQLRTAHQKEMIDLKAELEKKMVDMRELKNKSDLKRADLISSVESVNATKNKIAIAMANHRMDMYELLTPDQKKMWQEHQPMRDHMKMKFKERRFGQGGIGNGDFGPPPFDDDDSEVED